MIKEFQGEYRWLSNFAPVLIVLDGIRYPSVEHAYMSAKSTSSEWKEFCSDPTNSPGDVKKKSRKIKLRPNWDSIKREVMEECLRQKYAQEPYRSKLRETGEVYIQEGNRWGDKFWGVCLKTGAGQNILGSIIMKIREEIKII